MLTTKNGHTSIRDRWNNEMFTIDQTGKCWLDGWAIDPSRDMCGLTDLIWKSTGLGGETIEVFRVGMGDCVRRITRGEEVWWEPWSESAVRYNE